jgi:hypothetical protein
MWSGAAPGFGPIRIIIIYSIRNETIPDFPNRKEKKTNRSPRHARSWRCIPAHRCTPSMLEPELHPNSQKVRYPPPSFGHKGHRDATTLEQSSVLKPIESEINPNDVEDDGISRRLI